MKIDFILYYVLVTCLTLGSCSNKNETPIVDESTVTETGDNNYELSQTQFQSSGMSIGKMEMQDFHDVVRANGVFDVPPKNHASVSSYFEGTVIDLKLLPGEKVRRGQVLFILENPDYIQIQQEYLEASSQLNYLKSDYERQKNLLVDKVSSEKTYLKAESDYAVTKIKIESLGKKLKLMNIDPANLTLENIRSTIAITSPINGYVTQVNISKGTFLQSSEAAIDIVDTDHMHLELNVFERDIPKLRVGQDIRFTIQEDSYKEYEATIHLINRNVNQESRTVGVHGHLSNEKLSSSFSPGMYVEAVIYTASESRISLPKEAIVEMDGRHYVLVLDTSSNEAYSFVKREVQIGDSNDDYIEVSNSADFDKESEFLIKGAFNLIVE